MKYCKAQYFAEGNFVENRFENISCGHFCGFSVWALIFSTSTLADRKTCTKKEFTKKKFSMQKCGVRQ